ncbi:MAG TPA: homoserine kinase [Terriglobales bacterium]|nr:homoserine kinase [Terriglobales bacterium]
MSPSKKSTAAKSFGITLPATSANLGPAFDAAALAFALYLKIEARIADGYTIKASGRDADICGRLENHLILTTYQEVLQSAGRAPVPLALKVSNNIPIGKGCGSSAAARLAGIALANHYGNLRWTDVQIVGEASRREHHPDNASACWMGGLTVARMSGEAEAQVARIRPKGEWPLLLAVSPQSLSTEKARGVLPAQYSRSDAVTNIQNSMLLLSAFIQGNPEFLRAALQDRIHQPYRAALCPLLPAMQAFDRDDAILGTALSGAGPSVLIFLEPRGEASRKKVAAKVAAYLKEKRLTAELFLTGIADEGAAASRRK